MKLAPIILAAAITLLTASLLSAQPKPPSKEERLSLLTEKLQLSKDQSAKVETILAASQKQIDSLRERKFDDRRDRMEAMKEIFDEEDARIENLLTDAQKKSFAETKKEREHRRPPPPDGKRPPRRE